MPRFKWNIALFGAFLFLTPFVSNAQDKKLSKAPKEKVVWGLEQINLNADTSDALAASFGFLRDKMLPEEQSEFKGWNINLHATDSERGNKRNEKKASKYLKQVEATSKYFVVLVFEWDKEHLIKDMDVQINLPDTVPVFQEYTKKQVAMMAKLIIKESLRSAGLFSKPD